MGPSLILRFVRAMRFFARQILVVGAFLLPLALVGSAFAISPDPRAGNSDQTPATAVQLIRQSADAAASGNTARQFALLRHATRVEPDNPLPHWHLGQLKIDGQWVAVEEAQRRAAADPRQAEYRKLRAEYGASPAGQLALARWCRKHAMQDEAKFHWAAVISLQLNNAEALGAVGRQWYAGQLLTLDEIKELRAEIRAAQQAIRPWIAKTAVWQRAVSGATGMTRQEALDEIHAVRAVDAIPALEEVTLNEVSTTNDDGKCQREISLSFVAALREMPQHEATVSLARHAVLSPHPEVRNAAIYELENRPLHDYVPLLLAELAVPIESSFRVVASPAGSVHYIHSLYQEGRRANFSAQLHRNVCHHNLGGRRTLVRRAAKVTYDLGPTESPTVIARKARAENSASISRFGHEAFQIERSVASANAMTQLLNARVATVLANVTDQDFGTSASQWWTWWDDYNEYYSDGEPPEYSQYYTDNDHYYYSPPVSHVMASCFAAGTLVWTKTGLRPIESLELGDLVLAQDPESGELSYKPIMGRTVRPPSPIRVLEFAEGQIHATLGHPMWVAGIGWRMAKEIEEDALLHAVTGAATVERIEEAPDAEAYNLIVADWNTYFVGEQGILVHDNTPRKPTRATLPGVVAAPSL